MRRLLLIPNIIMSYLISLILACLLFFNISFEAFVGLGLLLIFDILLAAVLTFVYFVISIRREGDVKTALILKCVIFPAQIFNAVMGCSLLITLMTFPFAILILVLDLFSVTLSGTVMLLPVVIYRKELGKNAVAFGILGFLPIADIIFAAVLNKRLKGVSLK